MKISVIHKQVRKYTKDNTRHYSGNTKKNHSPVFHLFAWQEENHLRDPGKKKKKLTIRVVLVIFLIRLLY